MYYLHSLVVLGLKLGPRVPSVIFGSCDGCPSTSKRIYITNYENESDNDVNNSE
jgi:hypothetical protein